MPDVDIDFFDRDNTLKLFKHTPASIIKDGKSEKHKTGIRKSVQEDVQKFFRLFGMDTYKVEIGKVKVCKEL